jgi:hypothetical protein
VSIGELWPNIDKLDEINGGGGSVESILGNVPRDQSSPPSVVRMNENVRPVANRVVVDDAPGPSTAPSGGGGGVLVRAPQRTKPHEFCLPPSKLFHLVCGGRLLIAIFTFDRYGSKRLGDYFGGAYPHGVYCKERTRE